MNHSSEQREQMAQRQQYVSDVFHALGQPLTELQMCLEMALHRELDIPGYRGVIRQALGAAQRVIESAKFLRQLAEADDPGQDYQPLNFSAVLRETLEEFEPVAECNDVEIGRVVEEQLIISADPGRIRKTMFLVLDHCLYSARPGTRVHVIAQSSSGFAVVEVATVAQELLWRTEGELPTLTRAKDATQRSLQLAERMMAALGGSLSRASDSSGARLVIRLPLASEPYRQNETATLVS